MKPAAITEEGAILTLGDRGDTVREMQGAFAKYGYGINVTGTFDLKTLDVVKAFQRHFRPARIDGISDHSTRITLRELIAQSGRVRTIAARARDFARLAS